MHRWDFEKHPLVRSIAGPEAGDAASSSVIDRAIGDQHQQPFASVEAQSHLCSKTVQSASWCLLRRATSAVPSRPHLRGWRFWEIGSVL
jgi:hypothetical protein